ncbi:MAG TPA: hypothetical protein VJ837_05965, partial [Candidatus Paceibacterota bacterium]|nr:hypothetical protein [Candidatus Paceibacterota bacterium]
AQGYLLACSTQPSSSLVTKLKELAEQSENSLVTAVWDGVDLEKRLAEPRCFALGHLFFPKSLLETPWKLYNSAGPNKWTAHYRTYFLYLSSRISGRHPDLRECEFIVSLLEAVKPTGPHEAIRPRAIYFDDKHQNFVVFADYLVPDDQKPTLSPKDLDVVLNDGDGLHNENGWMSYITRWDIQVRRTKPYSDHFDLDHYDFYNRFRGNFEAGVLRGDYSVGELAEYGNRW